MELQAGAPVYDLQLSGTRLRFTHQIRKFQAKSNFG
jgi:hypothetical protein